MIDVMAFKMMTAAALVVTGAAAGQYQASRLTRRAELLEELISGMRLFRNEIYYTHDRLERVAARLTVSCRGCGAAFFSEFQRQLDRSCGRDTETIWHDCVERIFGTGTPLKESDRSALKSAGTRMGMDDVEGQCRYLEKAERELELRLDDARRMRESRFRLYRTLGLTAGCGAAILVF